MTEGTPETLTDDEKISFFAGMNRNDIFPEAFKDETVLTLLQLLAQRVIKLEGQLAAVTPAYGGDAAGLSYPYVRPIQ